MQEPVGFLSLPNAAIDDADVLILPVPYERTVTFHKGTSGAPRAILAASEQLEFYEEDKGWSPTLYLKLSVLPPVVDSIGHTEAEFHDNLYRRADELPRRTLLIALGGEHSITPALVRARMPGPGTLVQIDAHADLRPEYQGSEYNHACPMFRVRAMGHRIVQIGIRSLNAEEARLIESEGEITTFFDRALQQPEHWQEMLRCLRSLAGPVWLSIDMDGFDPALVPGVGTPQPGGLSWHQGLDVVETLLMNEQVDLRGLDIVELIPDSNAVSDMVAAKLVQKSLSYWGMARGYMRREVAGSQAGVPDD